MKHAVYAGSFDPITNGVLNQRLPPKALSGAIVLLSTTAAGLFDLRSTPVATVYPGVELHANLIAGMLDGSFKQQPPYALAIEVVVLFLLGIILSFLLPRLDPLFGSLAVLQGRVDYIDRPLVQYRRHGGG